MFVHMLSVQKLKLNLSNHPKILNLQKKTLTFETFCRENKLFLAYSSGENCLLCECFVERNDEYNNVRRVSITPKMIS